MDDNEVRYLHQTFDQLVEGKSLYPQEIAALKKALPELPKQKNLKEISREVHIAWAETYGNEWEEGRFGDLETWLLDLHAQIRDLAYSHPEFLETEEDYENAPEGTIVASENSLPWHTFDSEWSCDGVSGKEDAKGMAAFGRRHVLRWGWGNE